MKRLLIFALFLLYAGSALAQGSNWTSLNGPYGGDMRDIAIHPNGTLFALAYNAPFFYKSTDNGATWAELQTPDINDTNFNDLEIDGAGKIYAVGYQSVFTSTDLGVNWTTQNSGTTFNGASFIKKAGSNLYVLAYSNSNGYQNVYRSTNDGVSFTAVYTPSDNSKTIYELLINANAEVVLKVGGGLGIIRSAAGGASGYVASNTGITTPSLGNYSSGNGLVMNAANQLIAVFNDNVFKSLDNGLNWSPINKPGSETSFSNAVLAAPPSGSGLFISTNGHTYYSSNGGSSWVAKADLSNVKRMKAKDDNNVIALTNKGVSVSTDGGTSWTSSNSGIRGYTFNDFIYYNNTRLLTAPNSGLITSDDQGASWNVSASAEVKEIGNYDLLLLPNGHIMSFNNGSDVSVDGGDVWTNRAGAPPLQEGSSYDGTTIYARSGNSFYKSMDEGVGWGSSLVLPTMPASYTVYNFTVSASSLFIYLRNNINSKFELWKVALDMSTAANITGVSFANTFLEDNIEARNGKIYFYSRASTGSAYQLSISSDDGVTWSTKAVPLSSWFQLANNGYPVLGYYSGSIYYSRDDGANWVNLPVSYASLNNTMQLKRALVASDGYLYILLDNYGVLKSAKPIILPNPPTGLTNVGAGHNRVSLVWNDNSNNEEYFVVERSVGTNTQYDSVANSAANGNSAVTKISIQQAGLTPGTTYFFRVKAVNDAGESIYSNEVSVTTLVKCAPAIPDNRSWTGVTQNESGRGIFNNAQIAVRYLGNGEYTITDFTCGIYDGLPPSVLKVLSMSGSFTENCGVTQLYAGTNSGASRIISNGNGTWDSGTSTLTLKWQTDPRYAYIAGGVFSETLVLTLNASDPAPSVPSNVTAFVVDDTGMQVQWSAGDFQKEYTVERSTDPGFLSDINVVGTVSYPTLSIVDRTTTFINNTTYYYRVKAANGNASPLFSAPSSAVSAIYNKPFFTPLATVPVVLDAAIGRNSAAFIDFDSDGNEDLYFATNGNVEPSFLVRNKGDGTFEKTLTNFPPGTFVNSSWADFNNDGKIDFAGQRQDNSTGKAQVEIFAGNGDGTFTKVSGTPDYIYYFTSTFTWLDVNKDGQLDLIFALLNQVSAANGTYNVQLHLLRNDGASAFTDLVILDLGVGPIFIDDVKPADYDNDGDQDLLVLGAAVDGAKSYRMLQNDGAGNFTTVSIPALNIGTAEVYAGAWGDIDLDNDLDLFMARPGVANALFKNNGDGSFTHQISDPVSTLAATICYGGAFGDIDNDGDLDLFAGNRVTTNAETQFLFINDGTGAFTQITGEFATNYVRSNASVAFGDYDKDGFLDLATAYPDKNNTILRNNKNKTTTGNWSQVKLQGSVSNKSAIGARVSLTAAGKTTLREIQSNTGPAYNGQNSFIAHFGLGNANAITSITVAWPSGLVQTINAPPINQILTIIEDNAGPTFGTLLPAHGATAVAVGANLEITLADASGAVSPVAGKNLLLYKTSDLATPVQTVAVASLTKTGSKFTLDLAADLQFLTSYSVAIEAGAFVDPYGNLSAALAATSWSFTTLDNVPPVIAFLPVPTVAKTAITPSYTFNATITDNTGTVASASLFYRKVSSKDFTSLAGTFNTTSQKWEFKADAAFFDETGIQYYFSAKDGSDNTTRLPATTGKYFTTRLSFGDAGAPALDLVKGNGAIAGYQIISIPWEMSNKDIASNFEELGSGDKKKYRFLRYHETPSPGWDEYPGTLSAFARGEGYFLNLREIDKVTLLNGEAPKENRDTLFTLSLKKGWNQIGNPYLTDVQWNDVLTYNGITSGVSKLLLFGGSSYNNATDPGVIAPFKGGFVQTDNDISLKIPFKGQTSAGRLIQNNFSRDISAESWEVNFVLQQNDLEFHVAAIGMDPRAIEGKDIFDMPVPPPLFEDRLEMSVAHPEHFVKRLARDVVSTQPEYQWNFSVQASLDAATELRWDNSDFGDGSKELVLFDVELQKMVDMRDENSYQFNPHESRRFRIFFGENLRSKIKPERILLGSAYPNPTSSATVIPFTLPAHDPDYQVRLEVFDPLGRKVGTLANEILKPGFYETEWKPAEANLNNGLYIYRLVVSGKTLKDTQSGKIVLKK